MDPNQTKLDLAKYLLEKEKRIQYGRFFTLFPDEGEYRRELYPKHIQFLSKSKQHRQRAFVAANRTGKTLTGAFEMTAHLTGLYPKWWKGVKFEFPISAWAASIRNSDTKDIIQKELLGDPIDFGSGMIPKECLGKITRKAGTVADAIDTIYVKHHTEGVFDGWSSIGLKSYEQGRDGFQGTKKQVIWLDEEPKDYNIFTECLTRTMDDKNPGIIYCTFTPLYGLSTTLLEFLPGGKFPEDGVNPEAPFRFVTQVDWDEVPHLNDEQKKEMLASYRPHERLARSKGIPSLGSGAIYPYIEDEITVPPFEIPGWWPRAYGLDVGWNRTAAIWAAKDPDSRRIYLYSEHYEGQAAPAVHASAIKGRGKWIWGAIDPRSDMRSQSDGTRIIDLYEQEDLNLMPADNSVEAGIFKIQQLFESGQLKVFNTLRNWLSEYRIYRRDEDGKIIKKNDHLMDAMRYLMMTGIDYATVEEDLYRDSNNYSDSERNSITGY